MLVWTKSKNVSTFDEILYLEACPGERVTVLIQSSKVA